jgi:hypothetical protein
MKKQPEKILAVFIYSTFKVLLQPFSGLSRIKLRNQKYRWVLKKGE